MPYADPSKQRKAARESARRRSGTVARLAERVKDEAELEELPDRDTLLRWLAAEAKTGHVPAIRLLLEELRRDDDSDTSETPLQVIDELAERRSVGA